STTPCVRLSSASRSNFFTLNSIACVSSRAGPGVGISTTYSTCFLEKYKERSRRSGCGNSEKRLKPSPAAWLTCAWNLARLWKAWKPVLTARKAGRGSAGAHRPSTAIYSGSPQVKDERCARRSDKRVEQLIDRAVQILVAAPESVDLVNRVQDGGVVLAAELPADLRQRRRGELLHQVHGDLAREGDGLGVAAHLQVLLAQPELLADALLDQVDGDLLLLGGDDVPEHLLGGAQGDRGAGQQAISEEPRQRAFE